MEAHKDICKWLRPCVSMCHPSHSSLFVCTVCMSDWKTNVTEVVEGPQSSGKCESLKREENEKGKMRWKKKKEHNTLRKVQIGGGLTGLKGSRKWKEQNKNQYQFSLSFYSLPVPALWLLYTTSSSLIHAEILLLLYAAHPSVWVKSSLSLEVVSYHFRGLRSTYCRCLGRQWKHIDSHIRDLCFAVKRQHSGHKQISNNRRRCMIYNEETVSWCVLGLFICLQNVSDCIESLLSQA